MMLDIKNLRFFYGEREILKSINLSVEEGEFLSIMGPNGSGKTTLIRTVLGTAAGGRYTGSVELRGRATKTYGKKELAREMAAVFQNSRPEFDFTVQEIVEMGRYPYLGKFRQTDPKGAEIVEEAMRETGVYELRDRPYRAVSGGEFQRTMIARALCQQPKILILDEPVNHLDLKYSYAILNLLKRLNRERGMTILTILHDLNLAARYSDGIFFLKDGEGIPKQPPNTAVTEENVRRIYEVDVEVFRVTGTEIPYVIPKPDYEDLRDVSTGA